MASKKIAVLSGAFNPVTRAHVALTEAARPLVDQVLCVVPRSYPHKEFEGASLEQRLEMLRHAGGHYQIATTNGGLFIDIARELRTADPDLDVHFICGRDAAERILYWDYDQPDFAEKMLDEFGLLVAARQGEFVAPERFKDRVRTLELAGDFNQVSSTEVRRRLAAGERWEHLVPEGVVDLVARLYSGRERG